jgi:hypothetical protein
MEPLKYAPLPQGVQREILENLKYPIQLVLEI